LQFFTPKDEISRLVELCRKGNSKAQYELYRLYSKAMYNTSLRIVGNREEAEDVLQESFLDGFMKIDYFRGDSTFGAWLKSIVVNKSISKIRNQKLQWEELGELETEEVEEFDDSEETIAVIKHLIQDLPTGYRLVLNLYLFEGYDHKEIAEITGISEVTSRTQYIRAKQRLIELYKKRK
jgi:RNA polymerase sigma factor (sigma-70 family)